MGKRGQSLFRYRCVWYTPGAIPGKQAGTKKWQQHMDGYRRKPLAVWQIWLFGGTNANFDQFSDLWQYSITNNQWTWIKGANTPDATGVYGVQEVSSPGNEPGARYAGSGWTDVTGNFWLFGGFGCPATSSRGYLNDLWKFSPGSVFPVRLLDFAASQASNAILLQWIVADEENLDHFEIEKSLDGSAFNRTGIAKANNLGTYTYTDPLNGESGYTHSLFYRLRLVNKDSSFTYSKTVNVPLVAVVRFGIYPNPAVSFVQLKFSTVISSQVEIEIVDMTGKVVQKRTLPAANTNVLPLPLPGMARGEYLIRAKWQGGEATEKLVLK